MAVRRDLVELTPPGRRRELASILATPCGRERAAEGFGEDVLSGVVADRLGEPTHDFCRPPLEFGQVPVEPLAPRRFKVNVGGHEMAGRDR